MERYEPPVMPSEARVITEEIAERLWRRARVQFAMIFVAVVLGVIGTSVVVRMLAPEITSRMILNDQTNAAPRGTRALIALLERKEGSFANGLITADDADHVGYAFTLSENYRVKFFDRDGRIFWSSRPEDIGVPSADFPLATLRSGNVVGKLVTKPAREIDRMLDRGVIADQSAERTVVEIYTPVLDSRGAFLGAIEFYKDVTEQATLFSQRFLQTMTVLLALGGLSLVVFVALSLHQNTRRMIRIEVANHNERVSLASQQRLSREMSLLGDLNEWLQSSDSLDELFAMVARFLTHLLPGTEGSVYVYSNSRDVLDGGGAWNGATLHEHIYPKDCWALRRGRTYAYDGSVLAMECRHADDGSHKPYLCFPILAHGETVGLIHLRSVEPGATGQRVLAEHRRLAQMCAEHISMAIANVRMRDTLHEQASRDPLTGLFNRRHMGEHLRNTLRGAEREGYPLSVLALDVDHFKTFNDTFGHDAGDYVLTEVARVMRDCIQGDELAARPGGEEFTVILPRVDRSQAIERAEKLRKAIENLRITYGDTSLPPVTVSIGIGTFPQDGTTAHDLLINADAALYQAKDQGRNRVFALDRTITLSAQRDVKAEDVPRHAAE